MPRGGVGGAARPRRPVFVRVTHCTVLSEGEHPEQAPREPRRRGSARDVTVFQTRRYRVKR